MVLHQIRAARALYGNERQCCTKHIISDIDRKRKRESDRLAPHAGAWKTDALNDGGYVCLEKPVKHLRGVYPAVKLEGRVELR